MALEDLRRTERAFLFSSRSTAEVRSQMRDEEARLEGLDQEMADLRVEARRLEIPPPDGSA